MQAFQYWLKTEICFGAGSEAKTAGLVQKHGGTRILVVYGGGSCVRSGLLDRICRQLRQTPLFYRNDSRLAPVCGIKGDLYLCFAAPGQRRERQENNQRHRQEKQYALLRFHIHSPPDRMSGR